MDDFTSRVSLRASIIGCGVAVSHSTSSPRVPSVSSQSRMPHPGFLQRGGLRNCSRCCDDWTLIVGANHLVAKLTEAFYGFGVD
jgi:hypothetical protein